MEQVRFLRQSQGLGPTKSRFALEFRHVKKGYGGSAETEVYSDLAFQLMHGTFVAAVGPIGSGKTTMVNLMSGLERPTAGSVVVEGTDITQLSDDDLATFRATNIGMVPQVQTLIGELTVRENVELPLHFLGKSGEERRRMAQRVLDRTGLGGDAERAVGTMSVGEKQLVSMARALVCDPPILLLDEPTESLDPLLAEMVLGILRGDNLTAGKTVFVTTHDKRVVDLARRTLRIRKKIP
jgi:putative ABC transport system ATP-binding protein